jgi:hypothetical protein
MDWNQASIYLTFAITGSCTGFVVRRMLKAAGVEGMVYEGVMCNVIVCCVCMCVSVYVMNVLCSTCVCTYV